MKLCECGECELEVTKEGNRFISGHNTKGLKRSKETCEKYLNLKKVNIVIKKHVKKLVKH